MATRSAALEQYRAIDFTSLLALDPDEVVTHAHTRDVRLASGRTLALVTLDNGFDHTRPSTLGPASLMELRTVLDGLAGRAQVGEIAAVGITGKPFIFAAGADLTKAAEIPNSDTARKIAQLGHATLARLGALGVPSFAFINGVALGGGLEIALHATYRTIDQAVVAVGFPEVFLGIVPGWGGATLLPQLIGIEKATEVVISNALQNNKTLTGSQTFALGIADALIPSANFLEDSLKWADDVLTGRIRVERSRVPGFIEKTVTWPIAVRIADRTLASRIGRVAKSPYAALRLLRAAARTDPAAGFRAEDDTLAELLVGDQFRASIYAFDLVQKRARRPVGAPDRKLAQPVTKVGVLGAGLMASQFALLFLRRLEVPVVITDVDQSRVAATVAGIHAELNDLEAKGRISADRAGKLRGLIHGTTDRSEFGDCDFVIEAVFEDLEVKQQVFSELDAIVQPTAVFATNTSSLSIDTIASVLTNPARLVGFHFFNPVAVLPLIEVVRGARTSDPVLATAIATAQSLGKNPIITSDSPGFVVNRVLARLLGATMGALARGSSFDEVKEAVRPLGLPMDPFALLDLVGLRVAAHVLDTHHAAWPERYDDSPALTALADYGTLLTKDATGRVTGIDPGAAAIVAQYRVAPAARLTPEQLREQLETGLAQEIHLMLQEGVVTAPEDIDLCMIFGAGWPFQMGGVTPYLDRVGASERAFGATFHTPPIRGVS